MSFLSSIFKTSGDVCPSSQPSGQPSCQPSGRLRKGVTYQQSAGSGKEEILKCLFCDIAAKKEPGSIVSESSEFVVFRTIQQYTANHLLVVPRNHIQSVHALKGEEGALLVERMLEAGKSALNSLEPGMGNTAQFRFHIPPVNSIDHLHLHAIGRPETLSLVGALKYRASTFYCWDADEAAAYSRNQLK